jgi:hypothetical protein
MSICFVSRRSTAKSDSSYSFQFNEMARPAALEPRAPFEAHDGKNLNTVSGVSYQEPGSTFPTRVHPTTTVSKTVVANWEPGTAPLKVIVCNVRTSRVLVHWHPSAPIEYVTASSLSKILQGPTGVQNLPILRVLRVSHCCKGNRINGT